VLGSGRATATAPRELFVRRVFEEIHASGIEDQVTIQSFEWGAPPTGSVGPYQLDTGSETVDRLREALLIEAPQRYRTTVDRDLEWHIGRDNGPGHLFQQPTAKGPG
jgi:hypothetical protein